MATNQQIIDRALYELGYHEYGASADATDSGDALNAFNDMMHEWGQRGKDFNWFTQDTLSDTPPIPKWAQSGVISNLAMQLSAVFDVAPSQATAGKARVGLRTIGNVLINQTLDNADMSHLPQGQGLNNRYNIEADS